MLNLSEQPHRRLNPLTGEWVLVSPHRTQRPWQGQIEKHTPDVRPRYDPACYLCPGNERASGARNPNYSSTFVFTNDFSALLPDTPREVLREADLLIAEGEPGICKVVCFSPRHDLTLSAMPVEDISNVVDVWADEFNALGKRDDIAYVQIFENRGAMMGASNPHPHCQVWATATVPNEPAKEQTRLQQYSHTHSGCLLCDYMLLEIRQKQRLVVEDENFIALVPFWAVWPFETLIIGKRHAPDIVALVPEERRSLASILQSITSIYDRVFDISFPYTMGFHQRPTDGQPHEEWHMHAHFYPPLLRSATVRKFMVGYEMLASPQRDITPESAAQRLRELGTAAGAQTR